MHARGGTCGEHLTWIEENGVLTISGTGNMDDFSEDALPPWYNYKMSTKEIVIEEGVTSVGDYAFHNIASQYLSLPDSLTSIGSHAFSGCSFDNVSIPVNVVSIGDSAFRNSYNLKWIGVAEGNTKYQSIEGVLYNHDLDTLIQFPIGMESDSFTVPSGVTTIGNYAFYWSRLSRIILSDGVKYIGSQVFADCQHLSSILLPDSLTSIGDYAFSNCTSLTSVTIPVGVKALGNAPFQGCDHLLSFDVASGNTHFASLLGVLFSSDYTELIHYPPGDSTTSYTIPSCATSIHDYAFSRCDKITNIRILDGVTSIGDHSFERCSNLMFASLPGSLRTLGDSAFESCDKLKGVTVGSNCTSIGKRAFYSCGDLNELTISNGVKSIGESAFSLCSKLTSVSIPSSVESIGDDAFYRCEGLTSIVVADDNPRYVSLDGILFDHERKNLIYSPAKNGKATYTIPDGVRAIRRAAFFRSENLENVSIPGSVITIDDEAFYECSKLKNVIIANGVRSIGNYAFDSCRIESLTIPDSVSSIGECAFASNDFHTLVIPDSVQTIGNSAFRYCDNLETVFVPGSVVSMGAQVFSLCYSLKNVFYQGSVDLPQSTAFFGCNQLDILCVPPDFNSTSFCGENVTSSSDICQQFQRNFDHCFEATYINGDFVQQKRKNATLFESRTNDCVVFACDNESGPVSWSVCRSTDEYPLMCIDDKCVNSSSVDDEWSVVIGVDDVDASEFNSTEVKNSVSTVTGIQEDKLSVGIEVDESGRIIRVVVIFAKDESSANLIAEKMRECISNTTDDRSGQNSFI